MEQENYKNICINAAYNNIWEHKLLTSMFYMKYNACINLFMLTIEFLDPLAGHFSIDRFVHKTHLIQAKIKLTCSEHSSIFIFRPFFCKKSQQRSLKCFWLQCYTELFWPPLFWTWNFDFSWNWSTMLSCYVFNWRVFICVTHKINTAAKFDKAWKDHICYTTKCLGQICKRLYQKHGIDSTNIYIFWSSWSNYLLKLAKELRFVSGDFGSINMSKCKRNWCKRVSKDQFQINIVYCWKIQ